MKREIRFIIFYTVLGAFSGLWIALVLSMVGSPSPDNMLLTPAERADFEQISRVGDFAKNLLSSLPFRIISGAPVILSFAWFMAMVNPHIFERGKNRTGLMKAIVVLLLSLILMSVLEFFSGPLYLLPLLGAFLWFLAGETGWAGDFSSWGMGSGQNKARPGQTAMLGALFGLALWGILYWAGWLVQKYFLLVSEVLDQSGEVSYLGMKLLAAGIIFLCALGLAICAALVTALSPTERAQKDRLRLSVFPAVLFTLSVVVIGIAYHSFSQKYDLDKRSLSQAAGLQENIPVRTVLLLKTSEGKPQSCKLETTSSAGNLPSSSVTISYENLRKIEDYLGKHATGSVFKYDAISTLVQGYGLLWDVTKAMEWTYKSTSDSVLSRHILLAKLANLPVTEQNRQYLQLFSGEGKWIVGPKPSVRLAAAYEHFGMADEAAAWRKKAGDGGAQASAVPALLTGVIEGKLVIGGKENEKVRIGLLKNTDGLNKIDASTLSRSVIAAQDLDRTGTFRFEQLGAGEYLLAIMTDGETLSQSSRVSVENAPGVIKLAKGAASLRLKAIRLDAKSVKP